MPTTIEYPRTDKPANANGFTAWGTADSSKAAGRIRGVIVGEKGATYIGMPQKPFRELWRLYFHNHLAPNKPMQPGKYTLLIFDFLRPLTILKRRTFRLRARNRALHIVDPPALGRVNRTFIAQGTTTGNSAEGRMRCANLQFFPPPPNWAPGTVNGGNFNVPLFVGESVLHNDFLLTCRDNLGGFETITVTVIGP